MTIDKIDARKHSRNALKALRSQAICLREELSLPWRAIARVMGLITVFSWAQRYATEGEETLSVRTLTLPQE